MTLKCFYSNINITTGFLFSMKQRTNWRNKDEPEDLTLDSDYSGRVLQMITEDKSELTIKDVIERDGGEYQLMFIMKDGVKHLSSVTVNLTVSGTFTFSSVQFNSGADLVIWGTKENPCIRALCTL